MKMNILLNRDDRGATAVEYGLIAGLIALGLVGSLVATRTSLVQDYACVATAVGSQGATACAGSGGAPASPVGSYWSAKTLSSTTRSGAVTRFNYSDGTVVTINKDTSSPYSNHLSIIDPANNLISYYLLDSSGSNPTGMELDRYYSGTSGPTKSVERAEGSGTGSAVFSGSPPLPTSIQYSTFDTSGRQTSFATTSPTDSTMTSASFLYYSFGYFNAMK
jgi:pilus assembly protein Flp/PilA